jgi:hypothetical protein
MTVRHQPIALLPVLLLFVLEFAPAGALAQSACSGSKYSDRVFESHDHEGRSGTVSPPGQDLLASNVLYDLDHMLTYSGAKYDIVATKTFPDLVRVGMKQAMIDAIAER